MLEFENVSCVFGGVRALDGATFRIERGTIHGLIGPNGAGKTTAINLISGLSRPTSGGISFNGRRIDQLPAHRIAALGITRTFQNIRLFPGMSARENLIVAMHARSKPNLWQRLVFDPRERRSAAEQVDRAEAVLAGVGLAGRASEPSRGFSYGDQRRLEMARALATGAELLLLDEPAAGMNPVEAEALSAVIRGMKDDGRTVLLVEHNVSLVMSTCDRVTVLNFGRVIADGTPDEVAASPAVVEAYLGSER